MGTLEKGVIDEINKYMYDKVMSKFPFSNYRVRDNGINKKIRTRYVVDIPSKNISNVIYDTVVSYKTPSRLRPFDGIHLATFTKKNMFLSNFLKRDGIVDSTMFIDPKCSCSSWRDIRYDNIISVEYRLVRLCVLKRFLDLKRFDTQSMIEMCNYMAETKKALKTQINGLNFSVVTNSDTGYIFLHMDKSILDNISLVHGVANKFEKSEEKFA